MKREKMTSLLRLQKWLKANTKNVDRILRSIFLNLENFLNFLIKKHNLLFTNK